MSLAGKPAVFVDRDGTLIRDVGYLCRLDQMEILPRVPEALGLFKAKNYKVVVITNQSAVARGRLSENLLGEIHRELLRRLALGGGGVDAVYYCPHHPTEGLGRYQTVCDCRKPAIGLIQRATAEHGLEPSRSYVVGDQITDMEMAARSGARGIWILPSGAEPVEAPARVVHIARDLWDAACWVAAAED